MRKILLTIVLVFTAFVAGAQQYVVTQEHKDRAAEIVSRMTLDEKIAYVGGYEGWYIREV